MEVLGAVIGSIFTEPCRILFGSIYARINNLVKIQTNYKDLEKEMLTLLPLRDYLRKVMDDDADDEQQGSLPRTQVEDWLRRADKLEVEFNTLQSTATKNGDFNGGSSCLQCSLNCRLSKKIVSELEEAKHLIEAGRAFENMMVGVNSMLKPVEHIPGPTIEGQPTALKNLAKMMDLMRNNEVKRVGVWGMGGVGKTTLVKNLNNTLCNSATPLFRIIIWVTVSRDTSLKKIQAQIAGRLKMPLNMEDSEEERAIHLYNRLSKLKRFLLILDDVWEAIDLDLVGIPRLEIHTQSKIILTSRFLDVCREMMTDVNMELDVLCYEEAWNLFSQHTGEVVMLDHIRPYAEAVVNECSCLPLAIIVIGASMRGKTMIALWKDALNALKRSVPMKKIEEKVYKTLKWSYDSLPGDLLKSCFLFFCLFPEDYTVDVHDLVRYWLAEGLLDEQLNFEELENRGFSIIQSLKDSCLLEEYMQPNTVKMHDVVRDVGIWIASSLEVEFKSIVRAGIGLNWISQNDLSSCAKRVSFMNNNIKCLPDCVLPCPETKTLLLQGNYSLNRVPEAFLQGFQGLRILDLSRSKIELLPRSVLQLGELRALLLRQCSKLLELPPMATLCKLQVLDCNATAITNLPDGFEKLTNLRQLDISDTTVLKTIPTGTMSSLCNLEYLQLVGNGTRWGMKNEKGEKAPFEDLLCLEQLTSLYFRLDSIPHVTPENIAWCRRIKNFEYYIGENKYQDSFFVDGDRSVNLYHLHFTGEWVGWLLVNAVSLDIWSCNGLDLMLQSLVRNSVSVGPFANLKELVISYCCFSFQPVPGECVAQFDLLPNLELLRFIAMSGLESLSDFINFLGLRFSNLKTMIVSQCHQLENLLTLDGRIQKLGKLEEIRVDGCGNLTQVFKNISSNTVVPNLRRLQVSASYLLRKLPLGIESIEEIRGEWQWWDGLQWDDQNCKMRLQQSFIPLALDEDGESIY